MFGPKGLGAVGDLDGFVGMFARMGASKRDVPGGMPVLGEDDVMEFLRKLVDDGNDLLAFGYGERSAGAEVVLEIDDQESIGRLWGDCHNRLIVPLEKERIFRAVWRCIVLC